VTYPVRVRVKVHSRCVHAVIRADHSPTAYMKGPPGVYAVVGADLSPCDYLKGTPGVYM
jgi:hypothetical protein